MTRYVSPVPPEVEVMPPLTTEEAWDAFAQLEHAALEPIERALFEGLRARPIDKWCRACHRWFRYLLWRENQRTSCGDRDGLLQASDHRR